MSINFWIIQRLFSASMGNNRLQPGLTYEERKDLWNACRAIFPGDPFWKIDNFVAVACAQPNFYGKGGKIIYERLTRSSLLVAAIRSGATITRETHHEWSDVVVLLRDTYEPNSGMICIMVCKSLQIILYKKNWKFNRYKCPLIFE